MLGLETTDMGLHCVLQQSGLRFALATSSPSLTQYARELNNGLDERIYV